MAGPEPVVLDDRGEVAIAVSADNRAAETDLVRAGSGKVRIRPFVR
jgi:hypothetical protein